MATPNLFVKNIGRYAVILLAVGLTMWLEFMFTMEWSSPYCMRREDGPGYAAFGMPLPYKQFGGASSLEYEFMPHVYLLNLIVLCAIAFPVVRWTMRRVSTMVYARWQFVAGVIGIVLLVTRAALLVLAISIKILNPTVSIGSLHEPYKNFRPVGFSLNDGHCDCKPSPYWFPDGWQHD